MIQLYNYYRSSASMRVSIALNLKGVDYQEIPIHLINQGGEQFSSAYHAINPHSLVPTLKDDSKVITQSLAIIEFLEDVYPSPPLLPKDPYQKALVKAFALAIGADIHPLNNLRVLRYLTQELGLTEQQKNTWYHHWLIKGFTALEKQLQAFNHSSDYCFGDMPTLADICLVPQMYNARRFSFDLSAFPILVKIDKYCRKHTAFIKALPDES